MRHVFILLLTIAILLSLCACTAQEESLSFFYLRSEFLSGTAEGVIAAEPREVTGERGLNYTLRLYLEGPVSEQYLSPYPTGLRLLGTKQEQNVLQVYLSEEFSILKDIDLAIACACLANTCFDLTDTQQIQIITRSPKGDQMITVDEESFQFADDIVPSVTTE